MAQGLQINEDFQFQQRDWRAQRVGWCALGLLLLAGLVGFFGSGPVSGTSRSDGRGLEVGYERFVRRDAETDLFFRVAPRTPGTGPAKLLIHRDHLVVHRLERIQPEPANVRSIGEYVEYSFDAQTDRPMTIRFTLMPDDLGTHLLSVRLHDGPDVRLVQFTYP